MLEKSILELHELLVSKKTTPLELTKEAIERAKKDTNNAFEYIAENEALEFAATLVEPEKDNMLWGIPYVAKDNMSAKGIPTTGSSNILNGYVPVFDATIIRKLRENKAVLIGKSTLDELAMGGTGTSGHLGKTFNPWNKEKDRLVGGSSCGSAAITAAGIVPFALGSDTGDSTRKPASYAGLVGLKPTWGRISRLGLFPFAPSLDTVGIFSRNVEDSAVILGAIAGRDDEDSTSSVKPVDDYVSEIKNGNKNKSIAVVDEIVNSISDETIVSEFNKTLKKLEEVGYKVEHVSIPSDILATLFPTYFVISCAEATSCNANLDGIKFGPLSDGATFEEVVMNARTKGFSELIKRRFVLGSYALMKENKDELFVRAQKNRRRIVDILGKILENHEFIYVPATPGIAPKFTDASDKLSDEYLIADNHMVLGNFAGLPSITLPIGFKDGMPFGGNIMGRAFDEKSLFQVSYDLEQITGLANIVAKGE